jgi:UDP-N-acetyl-D-glucosamine/UDP-N-acetyl-D-galactosamine dehydrogenase
LIARLVALGHAVTVHDPLADPSEAKHEYGLDLDAGAFDRRYDLVVAAVPHTQYRALGVAQIAELLNPGGLLADFKRTFDAETLRAAEIPFWGL